MFTDKDLAQIKAHGLTLPQVEQQLEYFRSGFPYLNIDRAAVAGDGIRRLEPTQIDDYARRYDELSAGCRIVKFVPASGAATRMFKALFEYVDTGKENTASKEVADNLDRFAFADELHRILGGNNDPKAVISAIIGREGLDYGSKPKALILFHKETDGSRTALEEHLSEGALYAASDGNVQIHFTVSPEHLDGFRARVQEVLPAYEKRYGVEYSISYSQQKSGTDTIAVTPDLEPFREEDGSLLFRPAGHGALLENLNDIDADVIYIKTVDNVAPDALKADTVTYKKVIGGILLGLQQRCHSYLRTLYNGTTDKEMIAEIARFAEEKLGCRLPKDFRRLSHVHQQADLLYKLLDRPIRVCGMVRNEGEPGGGPFWVTAADGSQSLQIAESSQIAPSQREVMTGATHFNPVDLVCGTKDYRGNRFDLHKFVDPSTGFISTKSKSGRDLLAQELPGLWNGAMAHWNTIFVEVPITTFSPVKVIGDLLRPQHQSR